jgi:hypothetical protein
MLHILVTFSSWVLVVGCGSVECTYIVSCRECTSMSDDLRKRCRDREDVVLR